MSSESNEQDLIQPLQTVEGATEEDKSQRHALEAGVGAAGGGLVGALVGGAVGGKKGALLGTLAGAIAGGIAGETYGDDLIALEQQAAEVLGEASGEGRIPAHYTWEQLQQLSKPQEAG